MNVLVAGNSHLIGFKDALKFFKNSSVVYVPVTLCSNFEEAVRSETGQFNLKSGWTNMQSDIGKENKDVHFDLSGQRIGTYPPSR